MKRFPFGPLTESAYMYLQHAAAIAEDRRRFPRGPRPTPRPVASRKRRQQLRTAGRKAAR